MSGVDIPTPEQRNVEVISRPEVVEAYSRWMEVSGTERMVLDAYVHHDDKKVLDLGCGTGRMIPCLGLSPERYLGVDLSDAMLLQARAQFPGYTFVKGDIVDCEFGGARFEVVLLMNNTIDMIYPLERRARLLSNIAARMVEDGLLVLSSHDLGERPGSGYYVEDYHGGPLTTYRSSLVELMREVESAEFEVLLAARDFRNGVTDWSYVVCRRRTASTSTS